MPPRPARPLSTPRLLRVGLANSLAAMDEELFEEPIVERRYIWGRLFIVSDPAAIRRVMQDNADNYPRIAPLHRIFRFVSGSGMLCAEGELWRRHRRLLNPTLDHRTMLADLPAIAALAELLAQHLAALPPPREVELVTAFSHFVTAAAGHVFAAGDADIGPVLHRLGQYPGRYGILDFLPAPAWLRAPGRRRASDSEMAEFVALFGRLLRARREAGYDGPRDLLWRLANAGDAGDRLGEAEMLDEALTLGATAATPLRIFPWIWYLLATHPEAEGHLHAELDQVLGGRAPGAEDLPKLVYLRRVVDEALRLYPPAPTMLRTAVRDDVLGGLRVPRRTTVGVLPWVVHRHRTLWSDADRFDPERFAPEQTAARSRYAYLPFAIGPHVCIGASLALIEILVAVAVLAQRLRFHLVPGQRIEPVAYTNLHPRGGIRATVEPR